MATSKDNKFLIKFGSRLQNVVEELCKLFPKENDFAVLDVAIMGCNETNKRDYLAKEYYKYVYKYRDIIEREDEQALLNLDLSNDLETLEVDKKEGSLRVDHFKKLIRSGASAQTKKNFFDHLKILNKIIEHIRDVEKSVDFPFFHQ